ncbi:hypothetical protein [Halorussus halobius]|uniref:hypothetical protein n=1 Tax=Halorussus halobius TaxID=1710537 RepID=UPI0010931F64|nr:hypothetical protein [Halorussus halobius]
MFAYFYLLLGVVFVVDNATTVVETGFGLGGAAGIGLGLFSIGAGVLAYRKPHEFDDGTSPASTYLLVASFVVTVIFVYFMSTVLW